MTATIGQHPRGTTTNRANLISNPRPVGTTGYGAYTGGPAVTLSTYLDFVFIKIGAPATVGGMYYGTPIPVTALQSYTASCDVFTNKPIKLSILWRNSSDTVISTTESAVINGDQFAVRSSVTGTAPAGAVTATLTWYLASASTPWATNDELRVRRLRFGSGNDFFDGATSPVGTTSYVWWATPNASFSSELIPDPATLTAPIFATGYQATRQPRTAVHPILNSSELAVTFADPLPRAGTLQLLYETEAQAHAAAVLLAQRAFFDFADPDLPTTAMRFVVHGGSLQVELEEETRTLWLLRVPFQEVSA